MTYENLKSKWWYRLIKVVFLFVFVVVILIANGANIGEGIGRINDNKTLIYCKGGDKRVLTAKQAGVYFGNYELIRGFNYKKFYEGYYNEYDIKNIFKACYDKIPIDDIFAIQRVYEITGLKDSPRQYDEKYLNQQIELITTGYKSDTQKASYLDYSINLFDIKPSYSYWEFIMYFFIINISILILFEIARRIFYYIILGTFKPYKK